MKDFYTAVFTVFYPWCFWWVFRFRSPYPCAELPSFCILGTHFLGIYGTDKKGYKDILGIPHDERS